MALPQIVCAGEHVEGEASIFSGRTESGSLNYTLEWVTATARAASDD